MQRANAQVPADMSGANAPGLLGGNRAAVYGPVADQGVIDAQAELQRLHRLALDAQDAAQVAPPHRRDGDRARRRRGRAHRPCLVDQLISASGLRRYSGCRSHGLTNCSRSAWACANITRLVADGAASSPPTSSTLVSPSNTSR